jgi:hypothetical protein
MMNPTSRCCFGSNSGGICVPGGLRWNLRNLLLRHSNVSAARALFIDLSDTNMPGTAFVAARPPREGHHRITGYGVGTSKRKALETAPDVYPERFPELAAN